MTYVYVRFAKRGAYSDQFNEVESVSSSLLTAMNNDPFELEFSDDGTPLDRPTWNYHRPTKNSHYRYDDLYSAQITEWKV